MSTDTIVAEREVPVIDDDAALVSAMVLGLKNLGLPAVGVTSPIEALMLVTDCGPTCVVVDLKMPGVDGLDLVHAICGLKRHAVIVLSAFVDVPTTVEAMRLGAYDVLQKPVSIDGLYGAVREAQARLSDKTPDDELTFTRRERQVAELLVQGMTAKQIARQLELSPRTIEFFRASLMRKTHSPNLAALASALTRIGVA